MPDGIVSATRFRASQKRHHHLSLPSPPQSRSDDAVIRSAWPTDIARPRHSERGPPNPRQANRHGSHTARHKCLRVERDVKMCHPTNLQAKNQQANHINSQRISQTNKQPTNQPTHQQATNQPTNKQTNQSNKQQTHQPASQPTSQEKPASQAAQQAWQQAVGKQAGKPSSMQAAQQAGRQTDQPTSQQTQ